MNKPIPYVFDVCGTLYRSNTTYDFLLYYFYRHNRRKHRIVKISLSLLVKVIVVGSSRIGFKINLRAFLVGLLSGEPEAKVWATASDFVRDWLPAREIGDTLALLQQAQTQGHPIILASGSLFPVISPIAEKLKADRYHASTLESDEKGLLTGKYLRDIKGVKEQALNLQKNQYILVTDNFDDLPLIQQAQRTIIISKSKNLTNWKKKAANLEVEYLVSDQ